MSSIKTIYALLIGINNYPIKPLRGCINDVIAIDNHFSQINSTKQDLIWEPIFALAPLEEEKTILQQKGISYFRPTRENIISAFNHLSKADEEKGDSCLLYYSGHGATVNTIKIPIFMDYEPSGKLQSILCLDKDVNSNSIHHLLDKELGFLIANIVHHAKRKKNKDYPSIHFLSIMDCCHSGTNTKSTNFYLQSRKQSGKQILLPKELVGFTRKGNCYYFPFKEKQEKVRVGGIKNKRHINLSAAQSTEFAYELPIPTSGFDDIDEYKIQGIFTVCLLKILKQYNNSISYGELIQRIRLEVQNKTAIQVPHLDIMQSTDANLHFMENIFSVPNSYYLVSFRKHPQPEWILNAGAIQGITHSSTKEESSIQLMDGSKRLVSIQEVRASESKLDARVFLEKDKSNKKLTATIHQMPFPNVAIGFDKNTPEKIRRHVKNQWSKENVKFLKLVKNGNPYQLEINYVKTSDDSGIFSLVRPGSESPLFKSTPNINTLLQKANKVARFEKIISINNYKSTIRREDFEVNVCILEGQNFDERTLSSIPLSKYKTLPTNPIEVVTYFRKIDNVLCQPAIKVEIRYIKPWENVYWIGALYCDAQFGITDQYLQIQQIGKKNTDRVRLEFSIEHNDSITKWDSIPLTINREFHDTNVTEVLDYITIFIADSSLPFTLEQYRQSGLSTSNSKTASFLQKSLSQKDDWRTFQIPIRIIYPEVL